MRTPIDRRAFLVVAGGTAIAGCVPEARVRAKRDAGVGAEEVAPDAGSSSSQPPEDAGTEKPQDAGTSQPTDSGVEVDSGPPPDAGSSPPDSGVCTEFVTMYDTYAQALYFDGTLGPLTGTIYVDYILEGASVELDFWHGHGGNVHRFTLLPEHFETLKQGQRVMIETTEVDAHRHQLFIDPTDPTYRVPSAVPVQVPNC